MGTFSAWNRPPWVNSHACQLRIWLGNPGSDHLFTWITSALQESACTSGSAWWATRWWRHVLFPRFLVWPTAHINNIVNDVILVKKVGSHVKLLAYRYFRIRNLLGLIYFMLLAWTPLKYPSKYIFSSGVITTQKIFLDDRATCTKNGAAKENETWLIRLFHDFLNRGLLQQIGWKGR